MKEKMPLEKDFRLFLQNELIRRCKKNPGYSLRAFAKGLEMDFSTLSKLLKGQRPIGKLVIKRLSSKLGLDPKVTGQFLSNQNSDVQVAGDYQQISLDSFNIIADWYHYAILELMRLDKFE